MVRKSALEKLEKGKIVAFKDQGLSARGITKKFIRSSGVILNFLQLQEDYGAKKSSGRLSKLSKRDKRAIIKKMSNVKTFLCELTKDPQIKVSKSTMSRIINSYKALKYKKRKPQPRMTNTHQQNRLNCASWHVLEGRI